MNAVHIKDKLIVIRGRSLIDMEVGDERKGSKDEKYVVDQAHTAMLHLLEEITSKCDEVQQKVLADILRQNADTEYMKHHGQPKDRESFKSNVPIISYEDLKPDIERIANGDFSPILCARPITQFFRSSGTSKGKCKMIPSTDDYLEKSQILNNFVMPIVCKYIPGLDKGKALTFLVTRDETRTPGGLLARPATNGILKDKRFTNRAYDPYSVYTSPLQAIHCPDHFQSMYTQMLSGLYQCHEVIRIAGIFASHLVWAIHLLQRHYVEFCQDIATGNLSPKITDPTLRAHMVETKMQQPNPKLAQFLENACKGENWEGIVTKIWPNAKYVEVIVTGSMSQYIPSLNYYTGGLPIVSIRYISSECVFGLNLNPMCDPYEVSYTLMPNMAYFEFLPISSSLEYCDSETKVVDLANVEIGQEYELVVTTNDGLYRYRIEDVLCPTGFYNSAPQFKFVRRKNVLLSINNEKTTETELQRAIDAASTLLQPLNVKIEEHTSYAHCETFPGHYIIFLEFLKNNEANKLRAEVVEQCCSAMEGCLSLPYRYNRYQGSMGPLEIRVVENGSFEKLRDYGISQGASFTQFKMPRCLTSIPMLELLNAGVISSHFSQTLPPCEIACYWFFLSTSSSYCWQ